MIFFKSSHLNISILDGPSEPILNYKLEHIWAQIQNSYLRIIENTTFTIKCNGSTSNPKGEIYLWQNQADNNLTIRNIKTDNAGMYSCNVTNIMKRTFGGTEIGHNSTTINIDVLCKYASFK